MIGGGSARRLVVVLALIAGLFGMHALVVANAEHETRTLAGMPGAMQPGVPDPAMAVGNPVQPRMAMPAGALAEQPAGEPAATLAPAAPRHHPTAHQVLHLCLAILVGLLLVLTRLGLALSVDSVDPAVRSRHGRGRCPRPARPPPTSVRLAQLCVMRN